MKIKLPNTPKCRCPRLAPSAPKAEEPKSQDLPKNNEPKDGLELLPQYQEEKGPSAILLESLKQNFGG